MVDFLSANDRVRAMANNHAFKPAAAASAVAVSPERQPTAVRRCDAVRLDGCEAIVAR